jgi:hypothetical protein
MPPAATPSADDGLWGRLSVLTGLLALSALVCAAVLPSRLRSLNRAFGIESVIELHRFLGVVTTALVFAHLACVVAADPRNVALLDLAKAPGRAQAATGATIALVGLAALAPQQRQRGCRTRCGVPATSPSPPRRSSSRPCTSGCSTSSCGTRRWACSWR